MKANLSERFARDRGAPQDVGGVAVYNIYRRRVVRDQRIHIRRIHVASTQVQGLRMKVEQGSVLVNGRRLKDVILWADSAPSEVDAICDLDSPDTEFRAWNCWRDANGTMQAWIGDAGMVVEESGNRTLLKCSAGSHPFSPTDLEVELVFE